MKISAYVPCFNNRQTILPALQSLQAQTIPPAELFALDDGSTDGGAELVESNGFRCLRQRSNQGRGAARHRAMLEATGDLVVSCDATNVLPLDFIERLLPWFEDPTVAAVYGWIQDPHPKGAVSRWRARHLFKAGHPMTISHKSPLITYGTILRRSAVLEMGNFNLGLRHTEDAEMGERLLIAGYDNVFDPRAPVYCNTQNTLPEVLERYWRWYAGIAESVSWLAYLKNVVFSVKCMAMTDLANGDLPVALISLLCPHYQFWRSLLSR
jgi:glycosyltransferase involved in cell wall biosynthesis